jgi:hypothetical protein
MHSCQMPQLGDDLSLVILVCNVATVLRTIDYLSPQCCIAHRTKVQLLKFGIFENSKDLTNSQSTHSATAQQQQHDDA